MPSRNPFRFLRFALAAMAGSLSLPSPAQAQLAVIDPANLIQTALTAARTLQQVNNQITQITNQIRQLENDAKNLTSLGRTFAPDLMAQINDLNALMDAARGLVLEVNATRDALENLYTGDYRNTNVGERAQLAATQLENAREALKSSLLVQARTTEQLRDDQRILEALTQASAEAGGALSAQQATNELLAFQAQQSMRLQAMLAAQSRAEALERAREMESQAQALAQRRHFFGDARTAHPDTPPWK